MDSESGYSHTFPAVRGVQAGQPFYIAMCPLRIIPKIFMFDDEELPPELRAQRTLNKNRIPEIANYLVDNRDNYILSALTASVNAKVEFKPLTDDGPSSNMGILNIPMDAQILINDGQHRRAAIEEAIKASGDLGQDNVPVLFFNDLDLERSQQMFADLNKYAIRPSSSLSTLYDHRDAISELARYVAMKVEIFVGMTEMEKSTISNRSTKLFTLSGIKQASKALIRKGPKDRITNADKALAVEFWDVMSKTIPDWKRAKERTISAADLRQSYIHSHGVALQAMGHAGSYLVERQPKQWKRTIKKLGKLDWSRSNTKLWEGRAMVMGKMSKSRNNVILTSNLIKKELGIPLNEEETKLEKQRRK